MNNILLDQQDLQNEAKILLRSTDLLPLLKKLGDPIQTGSSTTGLMAYPDIDFAVQNSTPHFHDAITIIPLLFERMKVTGIKIADFSNQSEAASYYIGLDILFNSRTWHIDATITQPGPILTDPIELADWLISMTDSERMTIIQLKKELIEAGRYVGARSQPPYTFRSSHLYEAVLKGRAKTITEVERYFTI